MADGAVERLDARGKEHAQPGQILLSGAVYDSTLGLLDARPLAPVMVKGRRSPVRVYELLGLRGELGPLLRSGGHGREAVQARSLPGGS